MSGDYFGATLHARTENIGIHQITGIVTVNGVPARRKVVLFEYPSLRTIDAQWSDAVTGAYTFSRLSPYAQGAAKYGVIAADHTGAFDPEAKVGLLAT
jgi:hypothetical protein